MATWGFGLRAKSMLALLLACLLALIPAGLVGWQVLDAVREHFGTAYRAISPCSSGSKFSPLSAAS